MMKKWTFDFSSFSLFHFISERANCTIIIHSTISQAKAYAQTQIQCCDDDWIWKCNLSIVTFNFSKHYYIPANSMSKLWRTRRKSTGALARNRKSHHAETHWQNVLACTLDVDGFSLIIEIGFTEKITKPKRSNWKLGKLRAHVEKRLLLKLNKTDV